MSTTRTLLPLLLAALAAGCYDTAQVAHGTVSFTATPPAEGHSGALAQDALVCVHDVNAHPFVAVRLGSACTLHGWWVPSKAGGSATLARVGECILPIASGLTRLRPRTAVLDVTSNADVTLGGVDDDGRYVTYRFAGPLRDTDAAACDVHPAIDPVAER